MKTIVLGFKDVKGAGSVELLAGPNVPATEQLGIVGDAKQNKKFPNGIARVELCIYDPRTIAIATITAPAPKKESKP